MVKHDKSGRRVQRRIGFSPADFEMIEFIQKKKGIDLFPEAIRHAVRDCYDRLKNKPTGLKRKKEDK